MYESCAKLHSYLISQRQTENGEMVFLQVSVDYEWPMRDTKQEKIDEESDCVLNQSKCWVYYMCDECEARNADAELPHVYYLCHIGLAHRQD